jgi:DMSO/TMAO reductase YedYZ molybdopterin-dependent catalytic subunit
MADDRHARVLEARLKLRERWLAKMRASPGRSDGTPQGTGAPNRHGMPTLPPGQHLTQSWPVLDLSGPPRVDEHTWTLTVDGAVEHPLSLDWAAFNALPQTDDVSDFHCVTTWSLLDSRWRGVALADLAGLCGLRPEATHLLTHAYDGYTTNLPLEEALKDDVLLVHTWNGAPLPRAHGGPVRVITPQLYAWKGAKWIRRLEFLTADRLGFWEERGYSNSAHPWRDDRYA